MRIAIVNDLVMAVEALRRVVCSRPEYAVAWIARDGDEAVRKCASDRPDMILMDLIMPVMNGVEATRRIMRDSPCPILVVTATVDGNMRLVFEAMGYGALDAVNTPVLGPDGKLNGGQALLRKIEIIGQLIAPAAAARTVEPQTGTLPAAKGRLPLIVLGSSTGGPAALAEILSRFPADIDASIVIVQHIGREFSLELAMWLSTHCRLDVKVAEPGCRPGKGKVWLAGTNDHMALTEQGALEYRVEPTDCFYRPSVDVLFKSVAAHWSPPGVAALLTGMGRDGSEGLLALRRRGWLALAQDEATSIVYGMPRAAAELGAAEKIIPLGAMADAIIQGIGKQAGHTFKENHGKHIR